MCVLVILKHLKNRWKFLNQRGIIKYFSDGASNIDVNNLLYSCLKLSVRIFGIRLCNLEAKYCLQVNLGNSEIKAQA
jgi:hypothetical protein